MMKKFIASLGLACLLINLPIYGSQEAQAQKGKVFQYRKNLDANVYCQEKGKTLKYGHSQFVAKLKPGKTSWNSTSNWECVSTRKDEGKKFSSPYGYNDACKLQFSDSKYSGMDIIGQVNKNTRSGVSCAFYGY